MTLQSEIESYGFKLTKIDKCNVCVTKTYALGINGHAEIVVTQEFRNGNAMIKEWQYKDLHYSNLPLDIIRSFSGYRTYIHIDELLK